MSKLVLITTMLLLSLSAIGAPWNLYDALRNDDKEKIFQILQKDKQILQPHMSGLINKTDDNNNDRIQTLIYALEQMKGRNKCDSEIIKAIIGSGAITSDKSLMLATTLPCSTEVIELMINEIPENELAISINLFFEYLSTNFEAIFSKSEEEAKTDPASISYLATMTRFKKLLEDKCSSNQKLLTFCDSKKAYEKFKNIAQNYVKKMEDDEIQAKKDEIYNSSPQGIKEKTCEILLEIESNQEIINREKKIGRTSGVVNQIALHKAGSDIVDLTEQLNPLMLKYKKLTNKKIHLKACR